MEDIQRLARQEKLTLGEWVRRNLREICHSRPASDTDAKLVAIRRAAEYSLPSGDISEMLDEIQRGYVS